MAPARQYTQGEKFVRVIRLLERLGTTRRGLRTAEVADELGVTVRSAQRYVRQLRDDVGLDIEEVDGRLRLGATTRLPAMQLDGHQATALLIAVRLLQQTLPGRDPALVGAVAKLAAVMPPSQVTAYLGSLVASVEEQPENAGALLVQRTVVTGFLERTKVEVRYVDAQGRESRRVIHPYFLEPRAESRTVYVFAHDESTRELRPFRIDRIAAARAVRERFTVPASLDIDAIVGGSWGVWQSSTPDDVVLRFAPSITARVRQTVWHRGASLQDLPDGGLEMRVRVASEVEMRPWVLGFGPLVEVLSPPSLRDHVAAAMAAGARLYAR